MVAEATAPRRENVPRHILFFFRKLRFYTIKTPARIALWRRNYVACAIRIVAEQDSIVVLCGSDRFQQERVGDAWDALPLVVARFGKQRAGGDE